MLVVIPKDQFYQLHNTGSENMILLGSRGEPSGKERHNEGGKVIKNVEGQIRRRCGCVTGSNK